jgi:Hemerythrin HHE cation binding domain
MNKIFATSCPTATQMIRTDHALVMEQFHKLGPGTAEGVRAAAIRTILAALEVHAQLEEEIFYPALREAKVQSPALEKSVAEHDQMRQMIDRVRNAEGRQTAQDDAVCELMNGVLHHVADEETQVLPAAERFLGHQRLSELGARMASRRIELVRPRAAELASDWVRTAPARTAAVTMGALVAGSLLVGALRRSRRHRHL